MTVSTTVPVTIQIRRRHLLGLMVAVAALAVAATWALVAVAIDTNPERAQTIAPTRNEVLSSLTPTARRYVEGVLALSPIELAASYGTDPLDALALTPQRRNYVEGIMALTPEQLAAGFGIAPIAQHGSISRDGVTGSTWTSSTGWGLTPAPSVGTGAPST